MIEKRAELADLLSKHMKKAEIGDAGLATLVWRQCGILLHRSNVRNMRTGTSKTVRDWRQVAAIANVLRLDEIQATQLLQAAGHPSIVELWIRSDEKGRKLLSPWAEAVRLQLQPELTTSTRPFTGPFLAPNLPPRDLVGRDELLKDLKQDLLAGRSVALSALKGMAGIGKTALAIALAHDPEMLAHFQDGVLWANLGQKGDVFVELGRWARVLDIPSDKFSRLLTVEKRAKAIQEKIGMRKMLLVVDDAWDSKAALAFKVGGPDCAHLVTTRLIEVAVHFAETRVTTVGELNKENSLALLKQLAPDVVEAELDAILELIQAVGGLPLSLVLMGNYLRIESSSGQPRRVKDALKNLKQAEDRLKLSQPQIPSEGHPTLPPGASISLEAVIAVTEAVLDNSSRSTLYALSVFPSKPNSFSEEAALEVAKNPVKTIDELTDYSLLEGYSPGRYTMHQAIADYAGQKRTGNDAYKRMGTYFVKYVKKHQRAYDVLEIEASNVLATLKAASDMGMNKTLLQGVNAFAPFMETRGLYKTAEKYLLQAAEVARAQNDNPRLIKTLSDLGTAYIKQGDAKQAEKYFLDASARAHEIGDHKNILILKINLGSLEGTRGNFAQAKTHFQHALASAREIGNQRRICDLLQNLAAITVHQGEYVEADTLLREGIDLARKIDYLERLDILFSIGASLKDKRGDKKQAGKYLLDGLDVATKLGYKEHVATIYSNLGALAINQGQFVLAEEHLRKGLLFAEEIGHRESISRIRRNFGELATKLGNYEQAENYLEEALNIAKEIDNGFLIYSTFILQGKLNLIRGRLQTASAAFSRARELAEQANDSETIARADRGLAEIAAAEGDMVKARDLGMRSLERFEAIGHEEAAEVAEWLKALPAVERKDNSQESDSGNPEQDIKHGA